MTQLTGTASEQDPGPRPHVIVLLADDLGWGDVGWNQGVVRTRHLDRLAGEGVRLERFYVMPACSPTRAALLTGRSPVRYGMTSVVRPWEDFGLPPEEVTLAELFHDAGYATALVGKWHLGHRRARFLPRAQGFASTYGLMGAWIEYNTHEHRDMRDWQRDGVGLDEPGPSTQLLVQEAVRLIRGASSERPLFLYLAFNAPHAPTAAAPEIARRYAGLGSPDAAGWRRRGHAAAVHELDLGVGTILAALEEQGILADTLILFFSDNGAALRAGSNGPFRGGKLTTYEGGTRVPCFVHWPAGLPGGRALDDATSVLDLLPTLASAAGIALPELELDGRDLLPALRGSAGLGERELFLCADRKEEEASALVLGEWKLHERKQLGSGSVARQLFRLSTDPGEEEELSASHPERTAEMAARIAAWRALWPRGVERSFNAPDGWSLPADATDLLLDR